MKWYRLSAEQEETHAQTRLGVMYDKGLGVPQDYKAALKWYRLAAEQRQVHAQFNLGLMYENRRYVLVDWLSSCVQGYWKSLQIQVECV